jgi:hypothetical protein
MADSYNPGTSFTAELDPPRSLELLDEGHDHHADVKPVHLCDAAGERLNCHHRVVQREPAMPLTRVLWRRRESAPSHRRNQRAQRVANQADVWKAPPPEHRWSLLPEAVRRQQPRAPDVREAVRSGSC